MTTADIINSTLAHYPREAPLPPPEYSPPPDVADRHRAMLAVPSMERHMSDEGWQLALALRDGGDYVLHGHNLGGGTDVGRLLRECPPSVCMVQDQHEWDQGHLAVPAERFHNAPALADYPNVFKITVVKDTHRQSESAKRNSLSIGCNAWIIYYNTDIVLRTLSWLRPQHVIRTWHTINASIVPEFSAKNRSPCILSGAVGGAYPLRTRIANSNLRNVDYVQHPGYHNTGSNTPGYLRQLSGYKVAICTASKFGYALRKIAEATACGCRVITDLPSDEVMPEIDGNLTRFSPLRSWRRPPRSVCDLSERATGREPYR